MVAIIIGAVLIGVLIKTGGWYPFGDYPGNFYAGFVAVPAGLFCTVLMLVVYNTLCPECSSGQAGCVPGQAKSGCVT